MADTKESPLQAAIRRTEERRAAARRPLSNGEYTQAVNEADNALRDAQNLLPPQTVSRANDVLLRYTPKPVAPGAEREMEPMRYTPKPVAPGAEREMEPLRHTIKPALPDPTQDQLDHLNRILEAAKSEGITTGPATKDSFPKGGLAIERGPSKPKPSAPGDGPAVKPLQGADASPPAASGEERVFSERFGRAVGKPAVESTELPEVPPARPTDLSATKERLRREIAAHPERMQELADTNQRRRAADRMTSLERFEHDQLGYVVNPQSDEMKDKAPPKLNPNAAPELNPDPVYDKQGRPSLRGEPKAPSARVSNGPGEIVKLLDPAKDAERRRLQFVRRMANAHQLGPDAIELMRDPNAFSYDDLRELNGSLKDAESARRHAALADRWANYHMGSDLMRGHPRALGLYMRSLARAAAERDPTMMTAVNQGHGNMMGANQTAAMAMNQATVQQRREQSATNARMFQEERDASMPDAQLQLRDAALRRAMALPEPRRTQHLLSMQIPPQEVRSMVAAHEAGRGNANHPEVLGLLQGMSEQQREAWLRENVRGPAGRRLTPQEARDASDSMRSGAGHAAGLFTDWFRPSVPQ